MSKNKSTQYWLLKSEPSCYSLDTLKKDGVGVWDGVRNYQARNMLRDEIKVGDVALFYYSNEQPIGIAGEMVVVKSGYPDPTQFNKNAEHFDALSSPQAPRWYAIDVRYRKKYKRILTLAEIKNDPVLQHMAVAQKGNRLSVQRVSAEHYLRIQEVLSAV
ncbi:MAG TPA: EVE domain-containing protein [Candidatus Paceibacterota bacterium]|nr:EVE domain-containing protein [Candidatus Paceibacterota bacterium]